MDCSAIEEEEEEEGEEEEGGGGGGGGGGGDVAVLSFAQHVAIFPEWHNFRYYPDMSLNGLRKTTKNLSHTISGPIFEFETSRI